MDRKNEKRPLRAISEKELATVSGGFCAELTRLSQWVPGVQAIVNAVGCGCNGNGQHG